MWSSVKNISVESIKGSLVDFYESKKANYSSEKHYIVDHSLGQDVVAFASILGGTKILSEGIEKVGKDVDDKVAKNIINLAKYSNIRKYLGNSRIKQYLNNQQLLEFENILKTANPDVLKYIDELDEYDFAEMVHGYKDLLNGNHVSTFEKAIKTGNDFYGNYDGWYKYWKLTPHIKYSLTTIEDLKKAGKLLPTGSATDLNLAYIQAFTRSGDFINVPLRYNKEHFLGEYGQKGVENINQALNELRKVPERNMLNQRVFSGKTFSKKEFEEKFINGIGKNIEYSSFVSSTLDRNVAEGFINLTAKHAGEGDKIAVIQRIITKTGVYIDDLSDWGENLGKIRHSQSDKAIQVQKEVLMNAGSFKQISKPVPIIENGKHIKIGGFEAYYIDLEEL